MKKNKAEKKPKLSPKSLTPASYNPRVMSDEAKKALKTSMSEFNDISGITWNQNTGNIVTGHHRWQNLVDVHGQENLVFNPIGENKFEIRTKEGEDTTFVLRVVDWDIKKEKAANIAANSHALEGSFTADLHTILSEIEADMDATLFQELRFDELEIPLMTEMDDIGGNGVVVPASANQDEWGSDIDKIKRIDAQEREMFDVIQVIVTKGQGEQVREVIATAIEGFEGAKIR